MATRRAKEAPKASPRRRPATTPDSRENQMIALAVDLAEKQILEGTVSSQVLTHYLKLGSSRERLEQERLRNENLVLVGKAEAMASSKKMEELYGKAIQAMRTYSGQEDIESLGDEPED